MFILGIIIGLLISVILLLGLIYFKAPVEKEIKIISNKVIGKSKGAIIEAESEIEAFQNDVIEKNSSEGKSTRIEDLYDENI